MVRDLLQSITGYPGLLFACIGSGIVVPLPEDFPLIYAGARVASGDWNGWAVLAIGLVGVGLRDLIAWGIGRSLGSTLVHRPFVRRLVGVSRIERATSLIQRRGATAVLFGRFFVGFRAPVFMVAGASGIPLRSFIWYDAIGLVVAVPLTVALGFWFGDPLADAFFWALQRARLVMGVGGAALALWGLWRWASSPSEASAADDEPA